MEEQLSLLREKLSALSYNDVRKEAKIYSISARGKKTEIIDRILEIEAQRLCEENSEKSSSLNVATASEAVEPLHVEMPGEIPQKDESMDDTLNTTYTLETPNDEEFLSDDDGVDSGSVLKHSLSSTAVETAKHISLMSEDVSQHNSFASNISTSKMDVLPDLDNLNDQVMSEALPSEPQTKPAAAITEHKNPSLSKLKAPQPIASGRFAAQHKKLFEEMSSITDVKQKLQDRVSKVNNALSDRLKQLASPKKVRRTVGAQFTPPADPSTLSFKFGNVPVTDYPKIQNQTPKQSCGPNRRRSLTHSVEKKLDVKQRTMSASRVGNTRLPVRQFRQATTPVLTPRLERLATPKGRRISLFDENEENAEGKTYKTHKGRFEYVDTTKMTDRELKAYLSTKAQ